MSEYNNLRVSRLKEAVEEAKRFIVTATETIARLDPVATSQAKRVHASKEMGATKRASMDLTRVLVFVRNGG